MSAVADKIREIIGSVSGFDKKNFSADAPFTETGMDSLDLATVLLEVQEAFGVVVPEGDEDKYDTLNKLAAFVESKK